MIKFPAAEPLFAYDYQLRSRYSETDMMGVVHHGHFVDYFEEARTEMIRELGMPYADMEKSGVGMPVVNLEIDYKESIFYDELINIRILLFKMPTARLRTWYEVSTAENGRMKALARVDLCFMDMKSGRPVRAPENFQARLKGAMAI